MQRHVKIAFFISNECKNRVSITRIWNRVRVPGSCYKSLSTAETNSCRCHMLQKLALRNAGNWCQFTTTFSRFCWRAYPFCLAILIKRVLSFLPFCQRLLHDNVDNLTIMWCAKKFQRETVSTAFAANLRFLDSVTYSADLMCARQPLRRS